MHPGQRHVEIPRGLEPSRRPPSRLVGPVMMTIGATIAVVASFAPWLHSGEVSRSSYDLLGFLHLLRISSRGEVRVLARLWPLMPVTVIAAVVAAWWGWRIVAGALGLLGGLYAGALSTVVAVAVHDRYRITVSAAPTWTAIGSGMLLLGSLIILLIRIPSTDANSR